MGGNNMRKLFATLGLLFLVGLISARITCTKYTLDGNLNDWGVDLTGDWSLNSTWLPNTGVQFTIEDNYNPNNARPGITTGVHIKGVGSNYVFYDEPQVMHKDGYLVSEPFGNEYYDIEAFYLDEDSDCIYVGIVTSEAPNGAGDLMPGDLAMNLDRNRGTGEYGYEYGVKLQTYGTALPQFGLYSMPDWSEPKYIPENRPDLILSGTYIGQVDGVYVDSGIFDRSYTNYVIELAIPKAMVGGQVVTAQAETNNNQVIGQGNFHLTEKCGNDHVPAASEFPLLLIPVGITIVAPILGYFVAKKRNN